MKKILVFIILATFSWNAQGAYGTLGRDQCDAPVSAFTTSSADTAHATQNQIDQLNSNRLTLEAQLTQTSGDLSTYQGYLKVYFKSPWIDTMQAHMDNGYDCCESTVTTAMTSKSGNRFPAAEVVNALPPDGAQAVDPGSNNPSVPPAGSSCYGFSNEYCSSDWKRSTNRPVKSAPQCLQTGFAATPAWDKVACLHSGEVDPQVCIDTRIALNPNDSNNCMLVLQSYRATAYRKRQIAAALNTVGNQIQNLQYPNHASSEITSNGNVDFMSNIGSILGMVAQAALPAIAQYLSYPTEKDYRYRSPNSTFHPLYSNPVAGTKNASGPPAGATYYGPNYGYGFGFGGNYGAQPPAYQTGGFACSPGLLGSGLSLIGQLFGGGKTNFTGLGSIFGSNSGGLPSLISSFLYGNQLFNQPTSRFGGFTAPYQVGGVYGVRTGPPSGATRLSDYQSYLSGGTSSFGSGGPSGSQFLGSGGSGNSSGFNLGSLLSGFLGGNGGVNSNTGYLSGGYQQNPYFGNMGAMLSSLFNGNFNVNANANAQITYSH